MNKYQDDGFGEGVMTVFAYGFCAGMLVAAIITFSIWCIFPN